MVKNLLSLLQIPVRTAPWLRNTWTLNRTSTMLLTLDEQPERQAEAHALSGSLTVPITIVTKQDDSKRSRGWLQLV